MGRLTLLLALLGAAFSAMGADDCSGRKQPLFDGQPDEQAVSCQLQVIERSLPQSRIAVEHERAKALLTNEGYSGIVATLSAKRRAQIAQELSVDIQSVKTVCGYWRLVGKQEDSSLSWQVQLDVKALRHVCYRDLANILRQEMMNWHEAGDDKAAAVTEQELLMLIEYRNRARTELDQSLAQN